MEPASRRVLAGREGMGRPPRRFPRANGRFCTPHSDHRTTLHSGDTQHPHRGLHDHVGASPPRHSHRTRLTHIRVVSRSSMSSRTPIWHGRSEGEGGYGISR